MNKEITHYYIAILGPNNDHISVDLSMTKFSNETGDDLMMQFTLKVFTGNNFAYSIKQRGATALCWF